MILSGAPTYDTPKGPTVYRFEEDFRHGFWHSSTAGVAKWRSYEQNGADTQTVQDDYLRLQTAGTAQIFHACANRGFKLQNMAAGAKVRFGAMFRVLDADDVDVHIGLGAFDSDGYTATAPTDYSGFKITDGAATVQTLNRKDSSDTAITLATASDDTWMRVWMEFVAEATMSSGTLKYWLNGSVVGSTRITTFPDDLFLFPVIDAELQVASDYLDIKWMFAECNLDYTAGTP
jgi:hypothetical protein